MKTPSGGWRRIMAVGCSHGIYADQRAINAVLKFKAAFRPDVCIHLGDAVDTTCLRSGAKGTADEAKEVEPDIDGGINFLERLRPDVFILGNHEDRPWRLREHPNATIAYAAGKIVEALEAKCKKLRTKIFPYTGIYQGVYYGGVRYMHGVVFCESAVITMAEMFGNVVFAHTHRSGYAVGRRSDHPHGICVGCLCARENLDYAKCRRSTMGWSQGFAWGYYNDRLTKSQLWLHEHTGAGEWILPS